MLSHEVRRAGLTHKAASQLTRLTGSRPRVVATPQATKVNQSEDRLMKPSPLRRLLSQRAAEPAHVNAHALIAAIDAGGIPLHPAKVNQIARELGLEVSRESPVEDTIARIRARLLT